MARSPMGETRHWQIGPRIRVGGTLGKIGEGIKTGIAKVAPYAAAAVPAVAVGKSIWDHVSGGGSGASTGGNTGGWFDPETGESVPAGTPGAIQGSDGGSGGFDISHLFDLPKGGSSGGFIDWLGQHVGDISKGVGGVAGGIVDTAEREADRKQRADEFNKFYSLQQNNQAMNVASQLNRAPLADKGQYAALSYTGPQAFQPRDYTQGISQLQRTPTGGAQAQLATNNATAANYRPGAGGVNTSTLKSILARVGGSQPPPVPPSGPFALAGAATYPTGSAPGPMPAAPQHPAAPTAGGGQTDVLGAWQQQHPGQPMPPVTSSQFGDWYKQWQASGGH